MCHLVLINRSLGLEGGDREAEERILHTYTRYLMDTEKLGKYLSPPHPLTCVSPAPPPPSPPLSFTSLTILMRMEAVSTSTNRYFSHN